MKMYEVYDLGQDAPVPESKPEREAASGRLEDAMSGGELAAALSVARMEKRFARAKLAECDDDIAALEAALKRVQAQEADS